MERPIIAAFDFDGTITYRDTFLPFLIFSVGYPQALFNFILELPILIGYIFGQNSRQKTKERILHRFFNGWTNTKLQNLAEQFVQEIEKRVRPKSLKCIKWHLKQGHRCIIVSASPDLYLRPWAKSLGITDVLGSQIQFKNQKVTGALMGLNCWGPEKVRRLRECLGDLGQFTIYAYGDSRGDREMLDLADHSFYRIMPENLP